LTSTISPTRIERSLQIARRKTAQRGHKLLKNKQDEIVKSLANLASERDALRAVVDAEIISAVNHFLNAKARMSPEQIENAIAAMRHAYEPRTQTRNIMGIEVPLISVSHNEVVVGTYPTVPQSFENAVHTLHGVMAKLVELASVEKTCEMLEYNLSLVRRRINALEYKVIPEFSQNIKNITLRLSENERGNLVRLMKVKEIIAEGRDN